MSGYTAKALIEPRDYRVVFVIQKARAEPQNIRPCPCYRYRNELFIFHLIPSDPFPLILP